MQVKTKNLLVVGMVVVLSLVVWYQFLYAPMQKQASDAKSKASDATQEVSALRKELAGTQHVTKPGTKAAAVSTTKLTDAIPADPKLASFLRSIDAIRASSGVTWQAITPAVPTLAGNVATMTVGITVQGSYDQIAAYMHALNAMPRLFVIDTVNYTNSGVSGGGSASGGAPTGKVFAGLGAAPVVQAQISGRIFAQPGALGVAAAPAGRTATTPSGSAGTATNG